MVYRDSLVFELEHLLDHVVLLFVANGHLDGDGSVQDLLVVLSFRQLHNK